MRVAFLLALVVSAILATPSPAGAAYRSCDIRGEQESFGPSYVTSLAVRATTCARGRRVVRAFHRCRKAHGGTDGRCPSRVLRFRCTERRGYGRGQFSGKVTCTRGSARVRHTYTQFT